MERKQCNISFKADADLAAALENIPNRSNFIRSAILAALDDSCPLCGGTGSLTPHQKQHWLGFLKDHVVAHCKECNGLKLTCKHHHTGETDHE